VPARILYADLDRVSSGGSTESPSPSIELPPLYMYPPHLCNCSDRELLYLRPVRVWLFFRHCLSPLVRNVNASQCAIYGSAGGRQSASSRVGMPMCGSGKYKFGLSLSEMIAAVIKVPCNMQLGMNGRIHISVNFSLL